jgi:hypothetical protein
VSSQMLSTLDHHGKCDGGRGGRPHLAHARDPAGLLGWVGEQPLDQLTQLVRLRVGGDTFPDGAVETGETGRHSRFHEDPFETRSPAGDGALALADFELTPCCAAGELP